MKASVHQVHKIVHESTKQKMTFQNILFFYLYIFPCFYSRMSALSLHRLFSNIDLLLKKRIGSIFNSRVIFTWNKSNEIRKLFIKELDMELLDLIGIGCCSGIQNDPNENIFEFSFP